LGKGNSIEKRDYLVDNLKVTLMFTVVFGHTIEYYINQDDILKSMYMYIYIFHMPLFIFISGYLSKKSVKSNLILVKKLLIPYIFFDIVWYIGAYIVTGKNMFSIFYPGWTLWYLLSLFFWRVSIKHLTKIKFIIPISFALGLLIGLDSIAQNFLSISRTIVFLPFFLIGYYIDSIKLNKINNMNKGIGYLIVIVFILISIYISKYDVVGYKFLYNSHAYKTNHLNIVQGLVGRSLLYIGSIILSIGIINVMPNKKIWYSKYGKNTMNVYVFHIYLIVIIIHFIPKWNISLFSNSKILISPILIMILLSSDFVNHIYKFIFNPINKLFDYIANLMKI
jgi:fucose 4-O-acetylase-like acetyltransferase